MHRRDPEERDSGKLAAVLVRQMEAGLADLPADIAPERIALAYEPVWAIGTGRVAGPAEIMEAHALVRKFLETRFPAARASAFCTAEASSGTQKTS